MRCTIRGNIRDCFTWVGVLIAPYDARYKDTREMFFHDLAKEATT